MANAFRIGVKRATKDGMPVGEGYAAMPSASDQKGDVIISGAHWVEVDGVRVPGVVLDCWPEFEPMMAGKVVIELLCGDFQTVDYRDEPPPESVRTLSVPCPNCGAVFDAIRDTDRALGIKVTTESTSG